MKILYLCFSIVEADHFLPIYAALGKHIKGVQQDICVLDAHASGLNTRIVREIVSAGHILTVLDFFRTDVVRKSLLKLLSFSCACSVTCRMKLITAYWRLGAYVKIPPEFRGAAKPMGFVSRIRHIILENRFHFTGVPAVFSFVLWLSKKIFLRILWGFDRIVENSIKRLILRGSFLPHFESSGYDYLVLSHDIYQLILDSDTGSDYERRQEFKKPLCRMLLDGSIRKLVTHETYDQLNEFLEFEGISGEVISGADFFLSRGDKEKRAPAVPENKVVDIGSPRYSKYWCQRVSALAGTRSSAGCEGLKILYLPTKTSSAFPGLLEKIEEIDRTVFGLLDTFESVHLFVKPHPKASGTYTDPGAFTRHTGRVRFFHGSVDTVAITNACDILIVVGSSFVPHALWIGKPVVLLDGWAKDYGLSFIYKRFCYTTAELPKLIDCLVTGKPWRKKYTEKDLEDLFQCGVDGELYERYMTQKLERIFGFTAPSP